MSIGKLIALVIFSAGFLSHPAEAQEVLEVGITTTGIPFTFVDAASLQPTGAMVDLATRIAAENGMRPVFQVSAFPALIPALQTGKINLISAALFVTDKRRQIVDFSTPVYEFGEAMFVATDDPTNYTRQALKGAAVGAPAGSTIAEDLQGTGLFSEVKQYDSIADIMRDVKLGRIKAGFADQPIVAYQIKQRPSLGVRLVEGYQPMHLGQVALAVGKAEPELLVRVNAAIAKLKQSGELAQILSRYGL
ncbi:MAG: ABC transporter substrate-binding protein [Microlunatus sp.]